MALDKTIITKRLTYIKYLYQQGVEQSKLPEVIAGFYGAQNETYMSRSAEK